LSIGCELSALYHIRGGKDLDTMANGGNGLGKMIEMGSPFFFPGQKLLIIS
jgi:hypothetical protein